MIEAPKDRERRIGGGWRRRAATVPRPPSGSPARPTAAALVEFAFVIGGKNSCRPCATSARCTLRRNVDGDLGTTKWSDLS
jgi:hypothetical protein